jgi:diaminopimelate decarboxylase
MFTSNETTTAEYRGARDAGAIINLDDITQIENLENACGIPETVCCRYNPGEFQYATNAIMGHMYDTKFGMTKEQLFTSLRTLKEKGASRFGIHAMLASCSLEQGYYPALARELFGLVLEIRETLGITLSFVDMAGGVGIPYKPEQKAIDIAKAGEGVREVYEEMLRSNGIELSLFTEMGRYITGPHGYLLTTVVGKKHIWKEYIGVDASPADLLRPAMYGAYHHITVAGKENCPATQTVDVVGALCENNDKFAIDRPLRPAEIGDVLVIHDAGAHSRSMGYNYNGRLRCAEYLLRPDGSLRMVRRAETPADYFATFDIDTDFDFRS